MKDQSFKKSKLKHVYVFTICVLLIILLGGFWFYKHKLKTYRESLYTELEFTTKYQSNQISSWYQDEIKDVSVLACNPVFIEFLTAITIYGQEPLNMNLVTEHLLAIKTIYEKEDVAIIDRDGNILASSADDDVQVDPITLMCIRQAIEENMALTTDIYLTSNDGSQYLDIIAPIAGAAGQSAAVLLIRMNPEKHLFPVLAQDIGSGVKMERILVRKEGDSIAILNNIDRGNIAGTGVRISTNDSKSPTARAATGYQGIVEEKNFRGINVVAYVTPVESTPWSFVIQMEKGQAYKDMVYLSLVFGSVLLAISLVFIAGIAWIYNFRQKNIYSELLLAHQTKLKSENALKEKEAFLNDLSNSGQMMIWATDKEGKGIYHNQPWRDFTGRTDEVDDDGWLARIHPDDLENCLASYNAHFDKRASCQLQYRFLRKDGVYRWIQDNCSPRFDIKGEFIGYIGQCLDVTKQVEEGLIKDFLFDISTNAATTLTLDGLIVIIQENLSAQLECSSLYIALHNPETGMFTTLKGEDKDEGLPCWPADKSLSGWVINNKTPLLVREGEFDEMVKKGEVELVGKPSKVWLGVPILQNGNAIGVIVVQSYDNPNAYNEESIEIIDFVSRQISLLLLKQKAIEELKVAKEKAVMSDHLKTAFLNNLSHEIRTPLNAIVGFTEILGSTELTQEQINNYSKTIANSSQKLLSIIDDLVTISTIEAGLIEVFTGKNDVTEIIHEVFNHYEGIARQKGIEIKHFIGLSDGEAVVETDGAMLRKVLMHLVDNAVKFTNKGKLEFGCVKDVNLIRFHVADTGIGIDKAKLEDIFAPFHQIETELNKRKDGLGLGLPIAKAYIEKLGGEFMINSVYGEGTDVRFTIPWISYSKPENKANKNFKPESKKATILVAEDDENNRLVMKEILGILGYDFLPAENGAVAVDLVQNTPGIDLVFMDISMPVMDGLEATSKLKSFCPKLPVIALTAHAMSEDKESALKAGCDDFIIKPVSINSLSKKIELTLGKAQSAELAYE